MVKLFLDPYIFAVPNLAEGKEVYENFIDTLVSWESLLKCNWSKAYINEDLSDALFKLNKYPMSDFLKKANEAFQIQHVSVDAIIKIVNGFLSKFNLIERELLLLEIDLAEFKFKEAEVRRGELILEELFKKLLVCHTIHKNCIKNGNYALVSALGVENIFYSFDLNEILFEEEAPCSHSVPCHVQLNDNIPLYNDFESCAQIFDIQIIETNIVPEKKAIKLSGDHHGNDELERLARKLFRSKYVIEVINNLPFNSFEKNSISQIHSDGRIEVVLINSDQGFGMVIQTTGRNLHETRKIAELIKTEFDL